MTVHQFLWFLRWPPPEQMTRLPCSVHHSMLRRRRCLRHARRANEGLAGMDHRELAWLLLAAIVVGLGSTASDSGIPRVKDDAKPAAKTIVGRNTSLPCQVEIGPDSLVEWYKDGLDVHNVLNQYKTNRKGVLTIFNVTKEECGTYVCKVITGFGTVEIAIALVVQANETLSNLCETEKMPAVEEIPASGSMPTFVGTTGNSVHQKPINSSITFSCDATGDPRPQMYWLMDGRELRFDEISNVKLKRRSKLVLTNIQKQNSGNYTCVAKNRNGSINVTFTLNVVVPGLRVPELQALHPINTTVEYGGMAQFQCRVHSDARPHIQWLKEVDQPDHRSNTTLVFRGKNYRVLKSTEVGEGSEGHYLNKLSLTELKSSDSGMYICFAANTMGYSFKEAFLFVQPSKKYSFPESEEVNRTLGGTSLSLVIGIPSIIVFVAAVIFLVVHCRARYASPASPNKHLVNGTSGGPPAVATRSAAPPPPLSAAVFPAACSQKAAPVYNMSCEPQWVDLPPSSHHSQVPSNPPSSWGSQHPPHHRQSGAATPSSSAGDTRSSTRSWTTANGVKMHCHHHETKKKHVLHYY